MISQYIPVHLKKNLATAIVLEIRAIYLSECYSSSFHWAEPEIQKS